jgi:hypothetical protein
MRYSTRCLMVWQADKQPNWWRQTMNLIARLVLSARIDGNTAQEFHAAAQRHANMTWLWAIVSGCMWYFLGWVWAILPFALTLFSIVQSVVSTKVALQLEE